MALHQQEQEEISQSLQNSASFLLDDALYCEEERWEEDEDEEEVNNSNEKRTNYPSLSVSPPLMLLEQDLFWEDEELLSLFSKEKQTHLNNNGSYESDSSLSKARCEAVRWMLKVNARYGFSTLTAILAINYLDRFLSTNLHFQRDKPWMIQLVAVACLSLAAKVEETQVPLLIDFQVEETKFVFEAKTIQRMELLVLSSLQWKMNPVTPLSFLDHIIRRLGLKTHLHWEFLRRSERLLLSVVSDSRFIRYLPSVLATATMLHVINQVEPCNPTEYQNQLLGVLKISKEELSECNELICDISSACVNGQNTGHSKRKYNEQITPSSPNGVIDTYFSSDSSNDSWAVKSSSVSSSPVEPVFKKSRVPQEQQMRLSSLNRFFVDAVGSPP